MYVAPMKLPHSHVHTQNVDNSMASTDFDPETVFPFEKTRSFDMKTPHFNLYLLVFVKSLSSLVSSFPIERGFGESAVKFQRKVQLVDLKSSQSMKY